MPDPHPHTYETLRAEITARHPKLSKRLREISRFALDHPTDMAMETIATIAQRAKIQPSALIRFAKAFGYSGFSEMQRAFQSHVVERSASYKERVRAVEAAEEIAGQGIAQSLLVKYCNANIVALEELRRSDLQDEFEAAAKLLDAAVNIYVMAQRRSFPVASYLAYALNQAGYRALLLDSVGGMLMEHAQTMRATDVLIAITFAPYAPETVKVVATASKRDVPVIVITDSSLSPIAPAARVLLEVHDAQVHSFRSLAASMCIAQTLATSLAFRSRDKRDA